MDIAGQVGQVERQLGLLKEAIVIVPEALGVLAGRLTSVLQTDGLAVEYEPEPVKELVPLANQLRDYTNAVNEIHKIIKAITNHLEL